jgi:polyphosphate kinase
MQHEDASRHLSQKPAAASQGDATGPEDLINKPERFLNREMSWVAFNRRVLEEAQNVDHPLYERLRFLSIASNNLEEFFMVRVANLMDVAFQKKQDRSPDGLTAAEQLALIRDETSLFSKDLQTTWLHLRAELEKNGTFLVNPAQMTDKDRKWAADFFNQEILPVITPIAVDTAHPFPFMQNRSIGLVFLTENKTTDKDQQTLIVMPANLPRFVRIPGVERRFALIEDLVFMNIRQLFSDDMQIKDMGAFKVLREFDIEIANETDDIVRDFETALKRRRRGDVVRLTVNEIVSPKLLKFLTGHLDVDSDDVMFFGDLIGLSDVKELIASDQPSLLFRSFEPRFPERIREFDGNCFSAIRHKDIVVHHPYESFDVVVQFLRQAAQDPDVISIKQTIYRTSKKSPIVEALIEAAENGKSVTALVELKARFDEEANLSWAKDMRKAGVQVVFGFLEFKTHAKMSLVTRREGKKMISYVHYGTGNYDAEKAKIYTDLSFFTCDSALCRDAALLFNYMTGYVTPKGMTRLAAAPFNLRETLLKLIDDEIKIAQAGGKAEIWAKCNALSDPGIIDALYAASQAGVKIELVVRGICMLRPGIPGFSENIRVWSIVGRYLEHSRIYCFSAGYGLPSPQAKVFISSADLMPRNLNRRIETLVPILNATVHRQILDQIMLANLKDIRQSWVLQSDGVYQRVESKKGDFSAHDYFMNNPSLSGRGKALASAPMPPPLSLDQTGKK